MPYLGWLEYDGVELVCDERAEQYAELSSCGDGVIVGEPAGVLDALGIIPGPSPSDPGPAGTGTAPWWNNGDPEGAGLIGFLGLALDGVAKSPRVRSVTDAVSGDGGTPGPDHAPPREIELRVAVVAGNADSAQWGVTWLGNVLTYGRPVPRDATDPGDVGVQTPLPPRWGLPARPTGLAGPLRLFTTDPNGVGSLRTLYDVVLTEGPTVEATYALVGAVVWEVSATLTAAVPYLHRPAVALSGMVAFDRWPHEYGTAGNPWITVNAQPVTWVEKRARTVTPRGVDVDGKMCGTSSGCPDPVTLPAPVPDFDACSSTTPMVPTWAALGALRDAQLPARQEHVPVVVVETGGKVMRRLSIRIGNRLPGGFHDPTGLALRWELNVPFLPANARLILDGRTGTAIVHCTPEAGTPEQAIDAPTPAAAYQPAVYGLRSAPVTWPVFAGGDDLTFTAHCEDDWCGSGAQVQLFLAARTDTA